MSGLYDEYYRYVNLWRAAGDTQRLQLDRLFHQGFNCHETDTNRSFTLFTRGRDEAVRLQESWWVFFFEYWRLSSLAAHAHDFSRAHPLAMQLMAKVHSPTVRCHPFRNSLLLTVLYVHLIVDPLGFREEIERGFAHLDSEISGEDRFVFNYRSIEYRMNLQQWEEAYDMAQRGLAEANQAPEPSTRTWDGAWMLFVLCRICDALGKTDLLAGHAEHLEELSQQHLQLRRTQGTALCWRAVAARLTGDERSAASHFHKGVHLLRGLELRDTIAADPMARYYELGADVRATLKVRERELAEVAKTGMLHRACQVHVERCRLLTLLNELTPADLVAARQSIAKLRVPEWFLNKLERIESTKETS